ELRATPLVWIEDAQVFPDLAAKLARVKVAVKNQTGKSLTAELRLDAQVFLNVTSAPPIPQQVVQAEIPPGGTSIEALLPLGDVFYLWDEFDPHLYSLWIRIEKSDNRTVF